MVAALEVCNWLSISGGGKVLVNLRGLLLSVQTDPGAINFWWIYLTLFSTFVPSMGHAFIAASSLVTLGVGERRRTLAKFIRSGAAFDGNDRDLGKAVRGKILLEIMSCGTACGSRVACPTALARYPHYAAPT